MDKRPFDWNSVRLQLPKVDKQQLPQEECVLQKAADDAEEVQPLLRSRIRPNGSALQNSKMTGVTFARNERIPRLAIPSTITPETPPLPQKKRTRSLSGLVASNDFFISGPLTTTSKPPTPSCTGRDTIMMSQSARGAAAPMSPRTAMTSRASCMMTPRTPRAALMTPRTPRTPRASLMTPRTPRASLMTPRTPRASLMTPRSLLMTPRTPRKEVLADSLRGQFTPRNSARGGKGGNWAGGFLGRAIRMRDRMQDNANCGTATDLERKLQEQGLTPVYCPEPRCDTRLRFGNVANLIADLRVFLTRPVPEDFGPIECHIRRQVHAKWQIPSYRLYLTEGDRFLLSSRRRKKTKTDYTISLDEHDISKETGNYFGKLCSNFVGSEYWFYDKGTPPLQAAGACGARRLPTAKNRVEMGSIKYQVNVLGIAGPRRMMAIIPSLQDDGKPHVFPPAADGGPAILDDYKCGQHRDKMVIMHNKQPRFNKQLAAYCLNFNGRVTKPSVKNFQLVEDSDPDTVILQFGKIGRNLFSMDYQHPMSALQGTHTMTVELHVEIYKAPAKCQANLFAD